jgi:predicted RNA-binding Zn-ribbon protein involved in translation (DUF1610 family)
VKEFKYFGTKATNQNCVLEGIKNRLNSGNACCHSVQSPLCSRLLSKNLKIKIYNIIMLSVVLYGCENCSLILREEQRLVVFENRCCGEYLDLRGRKCQEAGQDFIMRSFITCTLSQILSG